MKYAFYPGCVSRGGCRELYTAATKVAGRLGIQLDELKDVACNGAGVLPQYISDPINARTLAKAERLGETLMTIWRDALAESGYVPDSAAQMLHSRADVMELLNLERDVDLLIPRGGKTFVEQISRQSRIPVLGHGEGRQ